jgi:hypothetical protein
MNTEPWENLLSRLPFYLRGGRDFHCHAAWKSLVFLGINDIEIFIQNENILL